MRQTMPDTLQATLEMSHYTVRKQARQRGLIGEALTRHNQGRVQNAERMDAVTAQLAAMVNRLPHVPPQLITRLANLDQKGTCGGQPTISAEPRGC